MITCYGMFTIFREAVVERTISPPVGVELTVSRSMTESDIVALFEIEAIPLDVRFGTALGTGVVVGVASGIVGSKIASKIVSRAMAKGTIKKAAGVIVSVVARALGARAGTVAGGAVAGGSSVRFWKLLQLQRGMSCWKQSDC